MTIGEQMNGWEQGEKTNEQKGQNFSRRRTPWELRIWTSMVKKRSSFLSNFLFAVSKKIQRQEPPHAENFWGI